MPSNPTPSASAANPPPPSTTPRFNQWHNTFPPIRPTAKTRASKRPRDRDDAPSQETRAGKSIARRVADNGVMNWDAWDMDAWKGMNAGFDIDNERTDEQEAPETDTTMVMPSNPITQDRSNWLVPQVVKIGAVVAASQITVCSRFLISHTAGRLILFFVELLGSACMAGSYPSEKSSIANRKVTHTPGIIHVANIQFPTYRNRPLARPAHIHRKRRRKFSTVRILKVQGNNWTLTSSSCKKTGLALVKCYASTPEREQELAGISVRYPMITHNINPQTSYLPYTA
ncbi:uncharacterized protein EV422DRAFT_544860 [Fimicolochytrium jonesii]|uniref:uncharacterized protein n=1 Tax=Fimicolochytrium jonesii TaxID=1396493 RepID=UPI0022FDB2B4|nr:uncharacterized protein EV422DRAFT_544860 [Fimicolochytrium jonesii]KAI8816593.1 hypothetical protein EV422DRAFT_544860 [Fimicolochytrium jonesii]